MPELDMERLDRLEKEFDSKINELKNQHQRKKDEFKDYAKRTEFKHNELKAELAEEVKLSAHSRSKEGTVSLAALGKIASLVIVVSGVGSTIVGSVIAGKVSLIDERIGNLDSAVISKAASSELINLQLAVNDLENVDTQLVHVQAEVGRLTSQMGRLEVTAKDSAKDSVSLVQNQLGQVDAKLSSLITKFEDRNDKYNEAISGIQRQLAGTLTTEDIEEKLTAVNVAIAAVRELSINGDKALSGQNDRIVTQRIQPRLDDMQRTLISIQNADLKDVKVLNNQLQNQLNELLNSLEQERIKNIEANRLGVQ